MCIFFVVIYLSAAEIINSKLKYMYVLLICLARRQLQKREKTGEEYGRFPFVWKTKIFKWKIN